MQLVKCGGHCSVGGNIRSDVHLKTLYVRSLFWICMSLSLFMHVKCYIYYLRVVCIVLYCSNGWCGKKFCVLVHGYGFIRHQILRQTKKNLS